MKNWISMHTTSWAAVTCLVVAGAGCTSPPKRAPYVLKIDCRPEATVRMSSASLLQPVLLGRTPFQANSVTIPNSLLPREMRRGRPEEATTILIEKLRSVALELTAAEEPRLYGAKSVRVPPWTHHLDLGFPAVVRPTTKVGVEFAVRDEEQEFVGGYTLKILGGHYRMPFRLELQEGRYVFQLQDPDGSSYSGLLELENSDDEFVRFAYVPVFQRITPGELKAIGRREREPRMYVTHVEGTETRLATVWIGSRSSTEGVLLGQRQTKNIEVFFDREDAMLVVDGQQTGPRFYVDGGREHLLKISIPSTKGTISIYGVLDIPQIDRVDTTLTSFRVGASNAEINQIIREHKVIKKSGVYQAPEDPSSEIRIYSLTLGKRAPRGFKETD